MSGSRAVSALIAFAVAALITLDLSVSVAVAGTAQLGHPGLGLLNSQASIISKHKCNMPFGSVLIKGSSWAEGLVNTGHDGANFDVYSNYLPNAGCDRSWQESDGMDQWGEQYQCAELAVRVADAEWGTGNNQAWINAGWDGSADDMQAPGQALGLTWTANGSGSLPVPGDLMIWSSSGATDPGHVAVVSATTATTVTFVGENQGYAEVTLPVSGTTVENDNWKTGSSILGWLSRPWQAVTPALPANAAAQPNVSLHSVACGSATACVAVGGYTDSSGDGQGLLLTGSGTSWTATKAPLPANAAAQPNVSLRSVACGSATACVAVGTYAGLSGNQYGLLLTGSGSSWKAISAPLPSDAGDIVVLDSVTCESGSSCVAAGYYYTSPGSSAASEGLLLTGAKNSWTATEAPLPSDASGDIYTELDSVSCASASSCAAAGIYDDSSGNYQGWLVTGSGTSWTATEAPLPPGAKLNGLDSVSCGSATSCVAAGEYYDSTGAYHGLLVAGSGTSWTATEAPLPADAGGAYPFVGLSSVTCRSATSCVAVGDYTDSSSNLQGLLIKGSGTSWTATEAPVPANATSNPKPALNAVACSSDSVCVAVASYVCNDSCGGADPLVVVGAGMHWAAIQTPLPGDPQGGDLMAVTCPTHLICVSAGNTGPYTSGEALLVTGVP
jgi:hypothetical protein